MCPQSYGMSISETDEEEKGIVAALGQLDAGKGIPLKASSRLEFGFAR